MSKVAEVSIGENRVVVNVKDLIFEKIEEIAEGYAEVKQKHSLFAKYPLEDGESVEDWSKRAFTQLTEENKKKDEESLQEYFQRAYVLSLDKHKLIFDTIKMMAKVFGQEGKVTDSGFKKCNYPEAREFVIKVLDTAGLSTKDFE